MSVVEGVEDAVNVSDEDGEGVNDALAPRDAETVVVALLDEVILEVTELDGVCELVDEIVLEGV